MIRDGQVVERIALKRRAKVLDYLELMKPELTGLSVLTALCGFFLASKEFDPTLFLWTGLGTLLVGGGAGALNQFIERRFDALMRRTERRPLAAGRLTSFNVLIFGIFLSLVGTSVLLVLTNFLTASLSVATLFTYLFVYTPLKRRTPWSTLIGGIPGALPPVMGWTAAANTIEPGTLILFGILFLWQIPHFLSLAWLYRKDYARAGYRVLSVLDNNGKRTSRFIVISLFCLAALSVVSSFSGLTGTMYLTGSLLLGILFLIFGILFQRSTGENNPASQVRMNYYSRQLFFASLVYLPALLFLMTVDKL